MIYYSEENLIHILTDFRKHYSDIEDLMLLDELVEEYLENGSYLVDQSIENLNSKE